MTTLSLCLAKVHRLFALKKMAVFISLSMLLKTKKYSLIRKTKKRRSRIERILFRVIYRKLDPSASQLLNPKQELI